MEFCLTSNYYNLSTTAPVSQSDEFNSLAGLMTVKLFSSDIIFHLHCTYISIYIY